ncbi:ring-cleaving dioxygenase [Pedobacter aquatilis]|uniref:ring-cleaving dioxygenase n=1 Tax=Pedobacter aquatilis TaxID=351343 RepID=UPI0025B55FE8|nr:ring-cleaving dioxygenase [Pedobacter aquatilis]MDN3588651.1 ring-cleaving dioxygenase [Pedobacter aquatilis]
MEKTIKGIHHITAIAGNAKRNYDFYTRILGLRLIKKTVNFDDPETYHLYYGDQAGTPGSILTFFPNEGIPNGRPGTRQATAIGYSVNRSAFDFWKERFKQNAVRYIEVSEKFNESYLTVFDPDGLRLELIASTGEDNRLPWTTEDIPDAYALKGFHNITLSINELEPTADILTKIFGYHLLEQKDNLYRFRTNSVGTAAIVDVLVSKAELPGHVSMGSVHHVAFRVENEDVLMHFRDIIVGLGLRITEKIDRNYFYSLYFREPGGILFELATENPGFMVDESLEHLGEKLMLPEQYEQLRETLEITLPQLS